MKPIIRWSLWDRRWSIFGWTLGISLYNIVVVTTYSAISGQAQALNKALDNMPASTRALFSDSGDLLSPVGYLSSKLYYLVLPMLFTILAIMLSSHLLSREEENKTIELLLARPISRAKLLFSKLTSGFIVVVAVAALTLAVTLICVKASGYVIPVWRVVEVTAVMTLMSLLFASVSWLVLALGKVGRRTSIAVASFIALGSYVFSSLETIASWLEWPAKLLPFHYYQPSNILNGTYKWWNAVGMLIATLIITGLAFIVFNRRDLA
jgi:ABC-2 type transport system permease protein